MEGLEDRKLLYAASGGAFAEPIRVTYSLVPDGTSVGGTPSSLFSTMNGYASTATWESAIAKAAAAWEDAAGVNLAQVSDDGSPVGSGNDQQGASNVGDIRIGAIPLPTGELAFAFLPPAKNGGSAAGDIFLNSNVNWGSSGYDLETVAMHEIGHSLGLDHSSQSSAVMYATYNNVKQSLTSDDTAGMQAIYGPRSSGTNTSAAHATPIALNDSGTATLTGLQIASASDQDWYSVVVPQNTNGTLTVTLQSTNLSALEPRLTIYNSALHGLAQAGTTTFGGTATVSLSGVSAGQTYYIKVTPDTSALGSAGAYGLTVATGSSTPAPIALPNTTVLAQPNQSGSQTAADTAGSTGTSNNSGGGLLGGLLGGVLNLVGGLVGGLVSLLDGHEHLVQVGNITDWAEALQASPQDAHRAAGHPHPHGPGHFASNVDDVHRTIGHRH